MIQHRIPLFLSDAEKIQNGPTAPAFTGAVSIFGACVSGIIFNTGWPLLFLAVVAGFYLTNEQFLMRRSEVVLWKKYRALSKENQKAIGLTPAYVRSLNDGPEWRQLISNVDALRDAEIRHKRAQGITVGVAARYNEAFERAIESETEQALEIEQHEKAVVEEFSRRGW